MSNAATGKPCPLTATLAGAKDPSNNHQPLLVDSSGNLKISGTLTTTSPSTGSTGSAAPAQATEVGGVGPDGNLHAISTDNSGNQNVNVLASSLPSNAAQESGGHLASLDTKLPAQGQALAASSLPVVLPAAQVTALTPPTTVTVQQPTGTNLHAVIDSGTVSVSNQPTTMTVTQATGTNLHTVVDSGTVTVSNQPTTMTVTQATGTNLHTVIDSGTVSVSNFPATQTVAGTVAVSSLPSIPAGTNAIGSVTVNDYTATGTITTQNSNPNSGTATTGSTVALTGLNGIATLQVQVSGTYTGPLTIQLTVDGANWIALSGFSNVNTGAITATIPSASTGIWEAEVTASAQVRVTALAAVTGTATVTLRASQATGLLSIDSPLPAGTNSIGNIGSITGALPAGTNVLGFTKQGGRAQAFAPAYNAYSTTNVTTSAYVQLVASTTTAVTYLDIFDSSGQAMILATGAAGSEVVLAYIPPGGDQIAVTIAATTRIAIKALTANATSGYILLNGWN